MVEQIHRTLKVTLCARGGAAAWKDHLPLVLLGMWAAPREESGISVAEVVLQQQLVVPGQLPPPTERPAGMEELSVPPAVIPPTGRSFAKWQPHQPWMGQTGCTWQRGGLQAHGGKVQRPLQGVGEGQQGVELQVGERVDVVSKDCLKPHLGSVAHEAAMPPTHGRPRTASVASVASPSMAEKPGGPV